MTSGPTTFSDTPSVTSSPASASGATHSVWPDGRTIDLSGPAAAPASLSARQAEAAGLLTSGTYGRTGSTSSASAALAASLESRSRRRTALAGSTLYTLTWKERTTPSGRKISALRASGRRTSGSDSSSPPPEAGWPTPRASCSKDTPNSHLRAGNGAARLEESCHLAGWATPMTRDHKGSRTGEAMYSDRAGRQLNEQVANLLDQWPTAGWPTTTTQDSAGSRTLGYGSRTFMTLTDAGLMAGWPSPTTANGEGGQKHPEGTTAEGIRPDGSKGSVNLPHVSRFAGWPTPMAGTPAQNGNNAAGTRTRRAKRSRWWRRSPARPD